MPQGMGVMIAREMKTRRENRVTRSVIMRSVEASRGKLTEMGRVETLRGF